MIIENIDDGGNGEYTLFTSGDCEYVNPVYHFSIMSKAASIEVPKSIFRLKKMNLPPSILNDIQRKADDEWQQKFQKAVKYELPEGLNNLLKINKKKEQEKALKDLTLDSEMYFAFLIQAGDIHKFKFSRYVAQYKPKDLANKIYPKFIHQESKDFYRTTGYTDLTQNQFKVALDNRRHTIADFLDKGDTWHCFFRTMAGAVGTEAPHIGQPHFHYISSAWGNRRERVVGELKSYTYNLKSLHVNFKRERNQDVV